MNMLEGESSGLSTQPAKRRRGRPPKDASLKQAVAPVRGRPRKDASLKQAEAAQTPVSEGRRANRTRGTECMVGEEVYGFIEATFGSGYLITVRIANSNTNLRGVVFKPGHCAPITPENDIAPNLEMITRTNVRFPARNQGQSQKQKAAVVPAKRKRAPVPPVTTLATVAPQPATYPSGLQTCDYKDLDVQMQTAAVVPAKRKRAPVPPVTTLATVAPQPATHPSGLQTCDYEDLDMQMQTAAVVPAKRKRATVPPVTTMAIVAPQPATYPSGLQMCAYDDLDVQMVEPLSMLPPGRAIPAGQVFVAALPYPGWQAGSEQSDNGSFGKGTSEVGQDETHKPKTAADIVMLHHIDTQGTSQVSDSVIEEYLKSSPENSGFLSEYEIGNSFESFPTESSHIEPLINFGSGSMTELLKAFEENSKERQLHLADPPPAAEVNEATTRDSVEGSIP